ncbi:MAG: nitrate transporter substrate-binding protein [Chloroflexi bacterium]|nr:nitrate transporter substrate-binding protein [Chloroflexota bacterium]
MGTPIVLGAPRPSPFFTPMFVAIDRGFLADEGLDGSMCYRVGVPGLQDGRVDFSFNGGPHRAFLSGQDVRLICGHATRETSHVLMMRPEIESVSQLELVLLPGGSGDKAEWFVDELNSILAGQGLDLTQSEITTEHVDGSHPEQWELLQQGRGDAATLGAPYWIFAAKDGYQTIGGEADFRPDSSYSGIVVAARMLDQRPEVVQAFVRAYIRAMSYCAQNPEGARETMVKYAVEWGIDNPEIAKAVYDELAPFWSAEVDLAMVDTLLKQTGAKLGKPTVQVEEFAAVGFLEEALSGRS